MTLKVIRTERKPEPQAPVASEPRIKRAESAAESYRKLEAVILALPGEQVGRVTCDVSQAAAIALGALPNLWQFRADIEATFRESASLLQTFDEARVTSTPRRT